MRVRRFIPFVIGLLLVVVCSSWGYLVHRTVNQLAVYELPKAMRPFFWKNRGYLAKQAPRPDIRRNADTTEAPRHFIDMESYGDSAAWTMPMHEEEAVRRYGWDSLHKFGYLPYVIERVQEQLTEAMRRGDRDSILYYATDLGHYIGDANVPLHTSVNYDGQLSGQRGIHSLWETMVPDLNMNSYRLRDGHKAKYISDPAAAVWGALRHTYGLVAVMLRAEKEASAGMEDSVKFKNMKGRNGKIYKGYTAAFVKVYGEVLGPMVNDQLLRSADMIADFWYTAWVNAGKPALDGLEDKDRRLYKEEYRAYRKNKLIEKGMLISRTLDGSE